MTAIATAMGAAAWLGIATSISPCPLATNIAAVSFLIRRAHSRRLAAAAAVSYAAGRAAVYAAVGLLIARGLAAAPAVSVFLQRNILPFVGPLLILVSLVLLGWLPLKIGFGIAGENAAAKLAACGLVGEFLLGAVFALTFCPVSAALFFGALLPMALSSGAALPILGIYGLATALPVGGIALAIAGGVAGAGKILAALQRWQPTLRTATSVIILAIGIWLTLTASLA